MNDKEMAAAFNVWMREYTERPEEFEREWQAVERFLSESLSGDEPSYGAKCAEMLRNYHDNVTCEVTSRTPIQPRKART